MTARIHILDVRPGTEPDGVPARATVGEALTVRATVLCDPADAVSARVVLHDPRGRGNRWAPMHRETEGGWTAVVTPTIEGDWSFTVEAWSDPVVRWRRLAGAGAAGDEDADRLLADGADLHERAATGVPKREGRGPVLDAAEALRDTSRPPMARLAAALSGEVAAVLDRHPLRELLATGPAVPLRVDRQRALFGSWYRLFPRSEGAVIDPAARREPQSGGLRAAAERLPVIAAMGFDVVHLPPVHPIGRRGRRGPDGSPAGPGDPGSPWAVGSAEGGHYTLHPELGTLADFDHFVATAADSGLEVALELSLRCSPDHPWVDRHPGWFERTRGDEAAESLLPSYERDPAGLTRETLRIVRQWARHGVRIFRIAEPGAWPLEFWQEVLAACHRTDPELLFVAGPGAHPALRRALARVGFHLCALAPEEWTDRRLLRSRLTELAASGHLRPQLDAAPAEGGRTAFEVRAVLAALLSPTWGIPAGYELCEQPAEEEYRYRPRPWAALEDKENLIALLTRLNRLRRRHPALQQLRGLRFHPGPAEDVLVFSKWVGLGRADVPLLHWQPDRRLTDDLVITMVNLTGERPVEAVLPVGPGDFGLPRGEDLYLHDELTGAAHPWRPGTAFTLDPAAAPACVLTVRRL